LLRDFDSLCLDVRLKCTVIEERTRRQVINSLPTSTLRRMRTEQQLVSPEEIDRELLYREKIAFQEYLCVSDMRYAKW